MQHRDVVRATAWVAAAGVGAGLALAGAALTGHLGASTTIQQISPASATAAPAPAPARGLSVQEIYRLDAPGVVQIRGSRGPSPAAVDQGGLGSGFVIDKAGHIVTSNNVISGAPNLHVRFSGTDDLEATVVGRDPSTDVAVLQVDAHSRSLSPLPLGDSDLVQVGDPVVAIGNTRYVDRTATVGVVSAVQHGVDAASLATADHAIETDASIDQGNSGGPLINSHGQVIGVSSKLGFPGVGGFAIPIDTVKTVVAQLLETGTVQHVLLGVETAPVTRGLARSYALPCEYGLLVESVTGGSSAAHAGLRAGAISVVVAGESYRIGGDIIVGADGKPVTTESQLRNVLETKKPGDRLALQIWRGARKETIHVRLARPPG
jgi:S1-C subfamily serine protease